MRFSEILNRYIQRFDCKAKEVSTRTGISAATLSRYRSGERLPAPDSEAVENLCRTFAEIAREKAIPEITEEYVRESFLSAEDFRSVDSEQMMRNIDVLVSMLNISINRLCRGIDCDTSAMLRFRNGTRKPAEPHSFAAAVAEFIAREKNTPKNRGALGKLLLCDAQELADRSVCAERLTKWLLSGRQEPNSSVTSFLNKLDVFDLYEYNKALRFDHLEIPVVPFSMPTSRIYAGFEEMMDAELDFLKATVFSKSMDPVFLYCDMPIREMANHSDFSKQWMFGMAMMLNKGLHLTQIHTLDRSFDELMFGLESFIPLYMTGQISPYYLENAQNDVFLHLLRVSGAAALSGEAIADHHADGRYHLTKSGREIEYFAKRAQHLLRHAIPLMDIYKSANADDLNAFLESDVQKAGKRRSISSTLPLYTMDEALMKSILKRNGLTDAEQQAIVDCAAAKRARIEAILKNNHVEDEICNLTEAEFADSPLRVEICDAFCEKDVFYNYEEYRAHMRCIEQFAARHANYTLKKTSAHAFRNLQIRMHEGKWAMISKAKAPAIHFVVHHPKLVGAIESFVPPLSEA